MAYIGNTQNNQNYVPAVDFFSGNGVTTAFTLSRPVASVAQVQAVISNVPQNPGDAYTVNGNTITFTSAPPSGTNNIYVYYTSPNTQVVQPGQGTVYPASLSTGGPTWDTSGNLGLGVTPSAWSGQTAIQVKNAAFWGAGNSSSYVGSNYYFGIGGRTYIVDGYSAEYRQQSGQHLWYTAPSGTAGSAISFTQAMTLDASGKFMLGTTSTSYNAILYGASSSVWQIANSTTGTGASNGLTVGLDGSANGVFIHQQAYPLLFGTNGSERMRIDSSGNLLVGTTSAVTGTNEGFWVRPGIATYMSRNGGAALAVNRYSSTGDMVLFEYGGATKGTISTNGTGVTYGTLSDYRLKENIQPMQNALAVVQQLNPVTYTWKADGSDGQGFIAHELQAVVPDCVTGEKDAVDEEGNPVYQGIDTSFLVATLTAAIKELKAELDEAKTRIAALEAK